MARTTIERQQNVFCSYYTQSDPIRQYMLRKLNLRDGQTVLEPAAGDGAFVEALLQTRLKLRIFCIDKNPEAIGLLVRRYGGAIHTLEADTVLDRLCGREGRFRIAHFPERFDRILGNPPYGAWLDYETRASLKKKFPGFHVRETYTLFILRCLELLETEGILTFIVPDTFLAVAVHRPLRELLLKSTEILEILTFPSKLFPGVDFGYSGLCVITLRKSPGAHAQVHAVRLISISTDRELSEFASRSDSTSALTIVQQELLKRPGMRIWTSGETDLEAILHNSKLRLGDVADCRTGIYTGDNKRFLRAISNGTGTRSKYEVVAPATLCQHALASSEKQNGTPRDAHWIPIVKGGSFRFRQPDSWAIDWSESAVVYYKQDTKARFQNSQFYFGQGIGVPMVTSSRVNAFLLDRRVFDQSVVAIFPQRREWLYPLLAILNSTTASRLLKEAINPTANNSANYLKRLPLPNTSANEMRKLGAFGRLIARKRKLGLSTESEESASDEYVSGLYRRGTSQLTTSDTWSNLAHASADTPLFPCLRETKCSYRSNRPRRIRSKTA